MQLSESRNIGALASNGEFIFFLDDDNVIDTYCVSELLHTFSENKKIAVAAPVMFVLADPRRLWWAGTTRRTPFGITRYVGGGSLARRDFGQQNIETEDCPNAFMIRSRIVKEVGLFDSRSFPSTYSEADFCARVRNNGDKVVVVPRAKLWHDIPADKVIRKRSNLMFRDSTRAFNLMRGSVVFRRKYSRGFSRFAFFSFYLPLYVMVYSMSTLSSPSSLENKSSTLKAYFAGVVSGLQDSPSGLVT
jgi:GT2 family glycosyltransferase